jgi:hypothetical protein
MVVRVEQGKGRMLFASRFKIGSQQETEVKPVCCQLEFVKI